MRNEPSEFAVHVEHGAESVVVLRPVGEMDMASQTRWQAAVAAVTARPYHEVIVDMTEVSFMDPSGLNCLIAAHRELRDAGVDLSVVNASGQVHRVCAMAGVFVTTDDPAL